MIIKRERTHFNQKEIQYEVSKNGCWICISHSPDSGGYPQLKVNKKHMKMSRFIYERFNGSIPIGMCVLHTCDNPRCINIGHLWLGTHKENVRDAVYKGRWADRRGEKNGRSKLTKGQVFMIRDLLKGDLSQELIAQQFGISDEAVSCIHLGKTWGWLV